MGGYKKEIKKVTLAYFSGTGNTKEVMECFERQLTGRGMQVMKIDVAGNDSYDITESDLIIILAPVYAFRLISIMEKWVKNMPETKGTYAAIISVSGGGEITPNTACRSKAKGLLKRKKYEVIYEKMIVMPSSFAFQATQQLNYDLIQILPSKVEHIIADMIAGKKNITKPKLLDSFLAPLGKGEHIGARSFGASIHASEACNQCGQCIRNCPKKNIQMKDGRPKFGFSCVWCMKCLYNCPQQALAPGIGKFVVLKQGFSINQMIEEAGQSSGAQKSNYPKNIFWQGAIDYLNEDL